MRFAVFTNVQHQERKDQYFAYPPYVREMNIWFRHVEEVEIVAPLVSLGKMDREILEREDQGIRYEHSKLTFTMIPSFHFLSFIDSAMALCKIPFVIYKIFGAMQRNDHLHLRCPGNIGLLACICQIFFPGKPKTAKYAGNWDPEAKQPWTYRLQKRILRNEFLTKNMQVLVYGEWSGQSENIKPFFTASFSEKEIGLNLVKGFEAPFTFLFVGNLVEGKRPLAAIQLVEELNLRKGKRPDQDFYARVEIFGDGDQKRALQNYVGDNELVEMTIFRGNRSLEELRSAYQRAHFVILPSGSEGWPKAIAEGMFFGCIPIATPVSCIPWMVGYEIRGILLREICKKFPANGQQKGINEQIPMYKGGEKVSGNLKFRGDVERIFKLLNNPDELQRKSLAAKTWSQNYTLEKFECAILEILNKEQ